MLTAAIVIVLGIALAFAYLRTCQGRRLDDLIVSGNLAKIEEELKAHPEAFKPKRGGSAGPLHLAANRGKTAVVSLLLEHDIDPNSRDIHGNTPLHLAASDERNVGIARLLVSHGADVNALNSEGYTPLAVAEARNKRKLAEVLLELGACPAQLT